MAGLPLSEVFDRAWRRQYPYWRAYALRLTRNRADAEDVLAEAATRTLKAAPDLDDNEVRLGAYMRTAIRNISLGVVQRRGREVSFDPDREGDVGSYASSALQLALDGERREQRLATAAFLHEQLAELPDEHREVLELVILENPPHKLREVAEIQGVGTSTVHYRLRRGLEALAEALQRARAGHGTFP